MPRESPFAIVLSKEERVALEAQARQYTSPYCDVVRAKIVLLAAEGSLQRHYRCSSGHAAPDCQQVAQAIRLRATSWPGVVTSGRASRPLFPPAVIVQVKALACELPHRL